jgi:hypothetical protein
MKILKIASADLYQQLVESFEEKISNDAYNNADDDHMDSFFDEIQMIRDANPDMGEEERNRLGRELYLHHFNIDLHMINALAADVVSEIDKMGVDYSIESFNAPGMAKTDKMILGDELFKGSIPSILFSIFHELAHFYQYRKYGHDFALSIYTNDISAIEEDVDKLLEIENTANKFGLMKARFYLRKYEIDAGNIDGLAANTYGNRNFVVHHVKSLKEAVQGMHPDARSIEQINEYIYNLFK